MKYPEVDTDDFRDQHERAFRDHILGGPGDHECDDLCSASILERLFGRRPVNEYPPTERSQMRKDIAEVLDALRRLAASWEGDADFLEDGDEAHNKPRIVHRKRKASPRELAAEAARQCAAQLRAHLGAD